MTKEIIIPRPFQALREPKRYKVYYGGRGGAKSHNIARTLLLMGMEKPLRIVCAREIQKSIEDSVHQLLKDIIMNYELNGFYTVQKNIIKGINGTEFKFRGLKHNTTDMKSLEGCDICWVEEAENVSDNSWEILIPTVRKEGSEIWISLNAKHRTDPTYVRFIAEPHDDVYVRKINYDENPFFPDTLRSEMEKLKKHDYEAYLHIWEGDFDTRRTGYVYGKWIERAREEGRVCKVPYDPASEVFTAWDLGFGDCTAIWWLQFVGRELRWIDYYENAGEQIGHYAQVVKSKNYQYAQIAHYLPHDAAHGNIRGDTVSNQLRALGLQNRVLDREQSINPGIELLRTTLDYSVFDAEKCRDGILALESYAYEFDEKRNTFKKNPVHDWSSHAADAARYAAIATGIVKNQAGTKQVNMKIDMSRGGSFMGA